MGSKVLDIEVKVEELESVRDAIQKAALRFGANTKAGSPPRFPLSPSAALKSERDLYYGLCNYYNPGMIPESDIEGRVVMLLRLGHEIERHLVDFVKQEYTVPFTNERVTYGTLTKGAETINLSGELDFIIKLPSGQLILCDSKSSAEYAFEYDTPKNEHIAQLQLYMHSEFCRNNAINEAWLFYYNKNNSDIRVIKFTYDPEIAEALIKRFQKVLDAYEKKELPEREYVYGVDWKAAYSPFRNYEWRDFMKNPTEIVLDPSIKNIIYKTDEGKIDTKKTKKEKVKYIVLTHGNVKVKDGDGNLYWCEMGTNGLYLKEKGDDGFEYGK